MGAYLMKKIIVFLFLLSSASFIGCAKNAVVPSPAPVAEAPATAKAEVKAEANEEKKAATKVDAKAVTAEEAQLEVTAPVYSVADSTTSYILSEKTSPINNNFEWIRVFFATDRNRTLNNGPENVFGDHEDPNMKISYGYCDISIPHNHRIGEIEKPSNWRFEFSENPKKHVMLQKTIISSKEDFFHNLSSRVKDSKGTNAFVFVHGYNVTFEEAAKRTAQISYDLAFDGAPVFYSWPSSGKFAKYTVDEQNIELTQTNLKNFLKEFFTYSQANNVYLIAHSMGNRALTRAVTTLLTEEPKIRTRLKEVILAAPDIDARVFKQDIAPALAAAGRPVTLYASSKDKALVLSNTIHGYQRVGDSKNGVVVVPGVETIDASAEDADDFWGHGYFANDRSVIGDIFSLIHNHLRADQRFGLHRIDSQVGRYWEFKH